ncbi:FAD-dependent oxidoreductase [Aquabacter spiritensis]|uniref:Fumarate reductase flavoprotein subunit n=1 Tax=Aquabacter spiritensis TaxID=933073 RepID=A0A4R3LRF3_9HYPH|nr:FAD-dependent oxidoreductase [Aquabacter spiritensis]TCT01105.1 fumarate reductase flavoprotein subunit [Aquabacter spiritensis]
MTTMATPAGAPPETIETDLLVVGAGASGLAAASEAARLGLRTILLEKADGTGGMMNWCVGTVTAVNTPHQIAAGIADSVEAHFEDLGHHAGGLAPRDNLRLRRILVDHTTEMVDWLTRLGIVFTGPMPDPPHRAPRMLNVVPSSAAFAYHLERACRRQGVEIRLGTRIERLVTENGRVVGADADTGGTVRRFVARHGVILATGDFSAAADFKRTFSSPAMAEVDGVAPTSTGDGHRMAIALGAEVLNGDIIRGPILRFVPPTRRNLIQRLPPLRPVAHLIAWATRTLPQVVLRPFLMKFLTTVLGPSPALFKEGAVLVNRAGRRFTDELSSPAKAFADQPGKDAYIVFDQHLATKFSGWPYFVSTAPGIAYAYVDDYRRCRPDIFAEAPDLAGLAERLGMPATALAETIAAHNAALGAARPQIRTGPFYALGPVRTYVVFTEGGLRIDETFAVIGADGVRIPGLYAVGSVGQGGLLLEGHGHHLDWAFISGRLCARHIAAQRTAAAADR